VFCPQSHGFINYVSFYFERLAIILFLTDEEKRMLDGEMGYGAQKGMELNVGLGEAMGAERMVKVDSCHLGGLSIRSAEDAGFDFYTELSDRGAKFRICTTTNLVSGDLENWSVLGLAADERERQDKLINAFDRMGALKTITCTPYLQGHLPRFGQHCSWMETSAIAFINSILGARTNREGGPAAVAAGLTGRAPEFGLHLDDNRLGSVLVHVTMKKMASLFEAGNLGYWFGKYSAQGNIVLDGIDEFINNDYMAQLCGSAATSGPTGIFHIVGITPEAPTLEVALGGKKPVLELEYGEKERQEAIDYLNIGKGDEVDWVYMGCPVLQLNDIREVVVAIEGKRVHPNVMFWITTSSSTKMLAKRAGYVEILEKAGVTVVADTCACLLPLAHLQRMGKKGIHSVVTNSTKQAHLIPGCCYMEPHYGDLDKCIEAAVTGKWR